MHAESERILIVDVESTCWEGDPPPGQVSDIIEIGVCVLDVPSMRRVERASIMVRPERSQVSPFCTRLTTLTAEQAAGGVSFEEACRTLRERYGSAGLTWASYGDYDRRKFEEQCRALGVAYPFSSRHINVKQLAQEHFGLPKRVGMAQALRIAGLPLDGTHHRGDDDAWNIAALLGHMLRELHASSASSKSPINPDGIV